MLIYSLKYIILDWESTKEMETIMKQIFDKYGNLKYSISDQGSDIYIYTASGNLVYRYNRASNMTYDASGNLVMQGNILLDLYNGG